MKSVVNVIKKVARLFKIEEYQFENKKNEYIEEKNHEKLIRMISVMR